jgi:predicted RNase H-like HicB family nuclease
VHYLKEETLEELEVIIKDAIELILEIQEDGRFINHR